MNNDNEKKGFCSACGSEMVANASFCSKCGNSAKTSAQQQVQPNLANNNTSYVNTNMVNIPDEYKPIGMWGYFGYQLLFSIPCIGFIFLLVFSLGGTQNKNLKNFARSYFCFLILALIISFIIISVAGIGAGIYSIFE